MTYSSPPPAFSTRLLRGVALVLTLALGGGVELLNDGRPLPSRLLGTWQEEEENKGAKGRDESAVASHASTRRRSPRPPSPPTAFRRHLHTDLVVAARTSATHLPLRAGAGQFQRC